MALRIWSGLQDRRRLADFAGGAKARVHGLTRGAGWRIVRLMLTLMIPVSFYWTCAT
jgi:hypothetical protein